MNAHGRITGLLLAATLGGGFACGAAKTGTTAALPPTGSGRLALELVDAPKPDADEIRVHVTEVRAHSTASGWFTVKSFQGEPDKYLAVDLLKLKDSALDLGFATLPAGTTITQLRLLVTLDGNSVVVAGVEHPLKVPSGYQSGIKIKGPWTIGECAETKLTIDFDAKNSIMVHPTGVPEKWILRPVVRVKKEGHAVIGCTEPPPAHVPDACSATVACPGTEICVSGYCKGAPGTACEADLECITNRCDLVSHACGQGGPADGCYVNEDCLSLSCAQGACQPSEPGGMCFDSPEDCNGGICGNDGTCSPPTTGGTGTACTLDTHCTDSAMCVDGTCAPGGTGTHCSDAAQCDDAWSCVANECVPPASAS